MIKKIFLHIGSHKTGTSAIQQFLKQNEKNLKKKQSIAFFRPEIYFYKHLLKLNQGLPLERFDRLSAIKQNYVIIAHENYSWLDREADIELFANKLYEYAEEVEIILYLRRQDSLAISQKQEGTKWRDNSLVYGHELKALPTQLTPIAKTYLNFYEKIQKWSNAFGEKNITVRIFEKGKLQNGDAVEDFCQVVGIRDYEKLKPVGRVNESISRIPQLFLHQTRKYFLEDTPEKHFLVKETVKLDFDKKDKLLPARVEAIAFYEQFKEDNRKLNEWMGLTDNPFLFDDDFSHYPEEGNGYELSDDEIIDIFHQIIQNYLYPQTKLNFWLDKLVYLLFIKRISKLKKLIRLYFIQK